MNEREFWTTIGVTAVVFVIVLVASVWRIITEGDWSPFFGLGIVTVIVLAVVARARENGR